MTPFNPMIRTSEAHAFVEIEEFVRLVIQTSCMPFHVEQDGSGQKFVSPRLLAKDFMMLTRHWSHYHQGYSYEPELQTFWDGCIRFGFINSHGPTEMAMDYSQSVHAHAYAVNDLVRFIRMVAFTKDFQRRVYDRKYQASEKCRSMDGFIEAAMVRYARSLVVRVDFGYQKTAQHLVTVADVFAHVDALCHAKHEEEDAFRGLVGYALAVEQGVQRGYHVHFAAIIDGNRFQNAWYRGSEFVRLWQRIAGTSGSAFICGEDEAYYHTKGVGHFRRDEPETYDGVSRAARYLTEYKEDQYLRARPAGRRVFRTFLRR